MTIKKVNKDGNITYTVTVNFRSKQNPKIRKQKKRSLISSFEKAKRIEKKLMETAMREVAAIDGQGYLWGQIVLKWYEFKKTDRFEHISIPVLEDYLAALKKWSKDLWTKPATDINRSDIKSIILLLETHGKSKSFQSKFKGLINRIFLWGIEERLIKNVQISPTYGINIKRKDEKPTQVLNKAEIKKLLTAAKIYKSPWYPIWAMALLTGCRNGELYALKWSDIDFENLTIRISKSYNKRLRETKSTKAGYWRNVPINHDLEDLLLELSNTRNCEFVLPRLRDWSHGYQARELRKFCVGIGITPISFHTLRSCFATQLLQNKVPPAVVMKICGWRDLDTMGRYIRLSGIDEQGATKSLNILPIENATNVISFKK